MNLSKASQPGVIEASSGKLKFKSLQYGSWEIDLTDLVLVGEHTTQEGPLMEDHFLVLITNKGEQCELPVGAINFSDALVCITRAIGLGVDLKLTLKTDFASRIIFPAEYEGSPLYNFLEREQSYLRKLLCGGRITRVFSREAESAIGTKH